MERSDIFLDPKVLNSDNNQIDLGNFDLETITKIIQKLTLKDITFDLSSTVSYTVDVNSSNVTPQSVNKTLSDKFSNTEITLDSGVGYFKNLISGELNFDLLDVFCDFTYVDKKKYDKSLSPVLFDIKKCDDSSYNLNLKLASLNKDLLVRAGLDNLEDILFSADPKIVSSNRWNIIAQGQHQFSVGARKKELLMINSINEYLNSPNLDLLKTLQVIIYGEFNIDRHTNGVNTFTSEQILENYKDVINKCTYFSFNKTKRSGHRSKLEID